MGELEYQLEEYADRMEKLEAGRAGLTDCLEAVNTEHPDLEETAAAIDALWMLGRYSHAADSDATRWMVGNMTDTLEAGKPYAVVGEFDQGRVEYAAVLADDTFLRPQISRQETKSRVKWTAGITYHDKGDHGIGTDVPLAGTVRKGLNVAPAPFLRRIFGSDTFNEDEHGIFAAISQVSPSAGGKLGVAVQESQFEYSLRCAIEDAADGYKGMRDIAILTKSLGHLAKVGYGVKSSQEQLGELNGGNRDKLLNNVVAFLVDKEEAYRASRTPRDLSRYYRNTKLMVQEGYPRLCALDEQISKKVLRQAGRYEMVRLREVRDRLQAAISHVHIRQR